MKYYLQFYCLSNCWFGRRWVKEITADIMLAGQTDEVSRNRPHPVFCRQGMSGP
jgi:hypothetical protein